MNQFDLDWIQWPAMVLTVLGAWWIGSQRPKRRMAGFIFFIISNALWVVWGYHTHAYALIILQVFLFVMNLRGFRKNAKGDK
jgi:nicotinamide riboside transporter PnuC